MEIKEYLTLARRWWWLLIVGPVLGAAVGYTISHYETPIYQSSTSVMVSSTTNGIAATPYAIYTDQQLAETYVLILTTQPIIDGSSEKLGYPVREGQISAQQVQDTQIIKITVEDPDPARAAEIANMLVAVLIEQNAKLQTGQFAASDETLQKQIEQVEQMIAGYQADLDNLSTQTVVEQISQVETQLQPLQEEASQIQQEIALLSPAYSQEKKVKVAELQARLDQITPLLDLYQQIYTNLVVLGNPGASGANEGARLVQLQSTLELYQQIYINLINSREAIRLARLQNTPNVVQLEQASTPVKPVRPRPVDYIGMTAMIGLALAAGAAFLVEYLDDSLKTPQDIERFLGLPVIGFIGEMNSPKNSDEFLYVTRQPRSPVSEAFRSLRVNLEFAGVDWPLHSILVTSPGPSEGKTTVSANLAAIIAQGGKKSLLLDADLRRPRVHTLLKIPNRVGLSELFRENVQPRSLCIDLKDKDNDGLMKVITSGSLPPNPAELLGSSRMDYILDELSKEFDMIVIDSPPTLVTDAQMAASKVDGILLVIQPGHTRKETALAMVEQFQRIGGRILGVVFNRIPRNRNHYYGGYKYYSPYYSSSGYNNYSRSETGHVQQEGLQIANRSLRGLFGKMNLDKSKVDDIQN
ncbi:MAG: polysaccharide biosynthesis tyrosine autokinase [Anaerolineales bacterium]|nr:polysaccharide biosynthesis tyrosine autokinase [Anaerolineales bacterium]